MREAHKIEATVRVGKNGLTDSVINEIRNQLKKRKVIKIKFLKTTKDLGTMHEFVEILAEKTGARILDVRGGTVVLTVKGR
ncbi:MAG: YhbY family RNA-binding protein [Thermoplasmata archaeon]|nr:YhbY family RNA-binding protein [Thermoplasmata archaeon]